MKSPRCEAYWRAGQAGLARQTLRELLGVIEPCGMRGWMGIAYRVLGERGSEDAIEAGQRATRRS
jgi:hypothetical protein